MAQVEASPILVAQPSRADRVIEGLKRAPLIPLVILLFFVALATFADFITPYSSTEVSLRDRLNPPFWNGEGSLSHPLGTDPLGRDLATRVAYGARTSLMVAAATVLLSAGIGVILGLIAGYNRGIVDTAIMRAADITIAFPIILFAIMLVVILGPGIFNLVVAVGVVLWARFARVIGRGAAADAGLGFDDCRRARVHHQRLVGLGGSGRRAGVDRHIL